ncbi:hypothetical protein [Bordetella genomosp. 4]|uniref:Uncharacterized protein n=1 Tax=Bordetella genomosp. 4 TaxID=463044 RepID=A0A261U4H1_9BORD|nr:hypothetical protein [Bordetella genomosp. 4]OZI56779.1 hypothetical protein CAL20_15385 [Bordetella genomosp. 4]
MTTDNKQYVLTGDEVESLLIQYNSGRTPPSANFLAAFEQAVLFKLRVPLADERAKWQNAQRIAELPAVDKALANFCDDGIQNNAVLLVQAILDAAPHAIPDTSEADASPVVPGGPYSDPEDLIATLEAAPQASADPTRPMLEGKPLDSEFSKVLADNFDELCIRPAAEDSAKGAGDVALPLLPKPQNGGLHHTQKDIKDYARAALAAQPAASASEACDHSEHVRPADGVCVECGEQVQPAASAEPALLRQLEAAANYIDKLGGDSKGFRMSALLSRYGRPAGDAQPIRLEHMAVADEDGLRWMSGRKMPAGVESVELYAVPGYGKAPNAVYAAPVASQKADDARDAERWRLLGADDIIQVGDEFLHDDCVRWEPIEPHHALWIGMRYATLLKPARRLYDAAIAQQRKGEGAA